MPEPKTAMLPAAICHIFATVVKITKKHNMNPIESPSHRKLFPGSKPHQAQIRGTPWHGWQ